MTESLTGGKPQAKNKNKPPKPSKTTLAFREYARVSYYLATIGDFNFKLDEEARELWELGLSGDDMSGDINLLTANRIDPDENVPAHKIPKGDHIVPGLEIRTNAYVAYLAKVKKTHKAAVKSASGGKVA